MTEKIVLDKIIDRVRKLLAMANDPSIGEEEAALFASKAADLLTAHQLSIMDIGTGEEPQEEHQRDEFYPRYHDAWRKNLAGAAARYYLCYLTWNTHGKFRFNIYGRESAVAVFKEMYTYLEQTIVRLGHQHAKSLGAVGKQSQAIRHDFEKGAGMQMAYRINRMIPTKTNNPGNLPALYESELDLAKAFAEGLSGPARTARTVQLKYGRHAMAGVEAANNISLNTQVKGDSKSAKLLLT